MDELTFNHTKFRQMMRRGFVVLEHEGNREKFRPDYGFMATVITALITFFIGVLVGINL